MSLMQDTEAFSMSLFSVARTLVYTVCASGLKLHALTTELHHEKFTVATTFP